MVDEVDDGGEGAIPGIELMIVLFAIEVDEG